MRELFSLRPDGEAILYYDPGGTVAVNVAEDAEDTTVTVKNDGRQILNHFLPSLFDRFTWSIRLVIACWRRGWPRNHQIDRPCHPML